jgi:preprotein translocase subunit SecE
MAKVATAFDEGDRSVAGRLRAMPDRTVGFFSDVRNEMRKVTFPSRKEVVATTTVVIITVVIFAAYFWVVDYGIGNAVNWLLMRGAR